MRVEVYPAARDAAARAASLIAAALRAAVDQRGQGSVAFSGGQTPILMLQKLASASLPWPQVHVFQVDERIVADDDDRRNLKAIKAALEHAPIPAENVHAMPVTGPSYAAGIAFYRDDLRALAGNPPQLDVVQLGLGEDGHTASLFTGDDALLSDDEVAVTGLYQGTHRMTLTLKVLDLARQRIWLVTGPAKQNIVRRFRAADPLLPASHVNRDTAILVLDSDAAGE